MHELLQNIWTNTQEHLDTYTKTFGQIHKNMWTNTHEHLDKYTRTFGQIHINIWIHTQKQVDKYTNTCKSWSAVRDYGPILWEIEAMLYILHLGMPKPLQTALFDLF